MSEKKLILFDKAGRVNTHDTISIAAERATELGIRQIVAATTTGATALAAKRAMPDAAVIGVTLHAGLWDKYAPPDPAIVEEARSSGVEFLTATHAFMGNVATAVHDKFGGICPSELIAHAYYTFGQGMKVAVEVAVSAADAGLLDMDKEVIAIAGTAAGADTAIVLSPAYTMEFFDTRIREIICMPR